MKIYILGIILICLACQKEGLKNDDFRKHIQIDVDKYENIKFNVSGLIDSIKIISFKTDSIFLVGGIEKLFCNDSNIFFTDPISMCIYVYDMEGNRIAKVAKRGRGKGEFLSITDFSVLSNNTIVLLDNIGGKIILYNVKGDFIQEIKISRKLNIDHISNINDDYLALFMGYLEVDSCLAILNISNSCIKKLPFELPVYTCNSTFRLNRTFTENETSVLFKTIYDYNIYKIMQDTIVAEYQFDFKEYNFPLFSFDGKYETFLSYMQYDKYVTNIDCVLENDNYLYCNFFRGSKPFELYYNKTTHIPYVFNSKLFPKQLVELYSFPIFAKDNFFIFSLAASRYQTFCELYNTFLKDTKLVSSPVVSAIDREDVNPYLFFIYTK